MEYTEHYDNMTERDALCTTANDNGYRMLHDDFDEDWVEGDEPHGTLTFTNEPAPVNPPPENPEIYLHPKFNRGSGSPSAKIGAIEDFLEGL